MFKLCEIGQFVVLNLYFHMVKKIAKVRILDYGSHKGFLRSWKKSENF